MRAGQRGEQREREDRGDERPEIRRRRSRAEQSAGADRDEQSPASGQAPALWCRSNEPAGGSHRQAREEGERGQRVGGQAAEAGAEIGHCGVRASGRRRRAEGIAAVGRGL